MNQLTVIIARQEEQDETAGPAISPVLAALQARTGSIHFAGRFPGKDIDVLLTGRVVVVGEEHQLAAVALRLLRRSLLGSGSGVDLGYVPMSKNEFSRTWNLEVGVNAVELACDGPSRELPLVRDDAGGVLVSVGEIVQPNATVYLDEKRLLDGQARRLLVRPHPAHGLAVTVQQRRGIGALSLGHRSTTTLGRAMAAGARLDSVLTVISDGVQRPRPMQRWNYYQHTEPLRLAVPTGK